MYIKKGGQVYTAKQKRTAACKRLCLAQHHTMHRSFIFRQISVCLHHIAVVCPPYLRSGNQIQKRQTRVDSLYNNFAVSAGHFGFLHIFEGHKSEHSSVRQRRMGNSPAIILRARLSRSLFCFSSHSAQGVPVSRQSFCVFL